MSQFCLTCRGDEYDHVTCENPVCAHYGEPIPCGHECKVKQDENMALGYLDELWD